ncbi:hypothetical protein ACIBF5_09880 [Micromonospora sp. NPDC050417]|uniref:hypothetical protein n=1 Tax=Micromonospora sp. NPDC050417 TaxID=3364280 RepID=UPI00378C4FF5
MDPTTAELTGTALMMAFIVALFWVSTRGERGASKAEVRSLTNEVRRLVAELREHREDANREGRS